MAKIQHVEEKVEHAIGDVYRSIGREVVLAFAYAGGAFQYHHCAANEAADLIEEYKNDGTITIEEVYPEYKVYTFEPDIVIIMKPSEVYVKTTATTEREI